MNLMIMIFFELNEEDKRFINDNIDSFIDENPFFLVEKKHMKSHNGKISLIIITIMI